MLFSLAPIALLITGLLVLAGFYALRAIVTRVSGSGHKATYFRQSLGVFAACGLALAVLTYVKRSDIRSQSAVTSIAFVPYDGDDPSSNIGSFAPGEAIQQKTTSDGEMLVLPLSDQVLTGLLGEEGMRAIGLLNECVPPELRQAYAMIPVSSARSMLPGPIGPSVIPESVSEHGLSFLQNAVTQLLTPQSPDPAEALLTKIEADDSENDLPDWIENPPIDCFVVKSPFQDPSVEAEDALRPEITRAYSQHLDELIGRQFGTTKGLDEFVDVSFADTAIRECIVEQSTRTMVLEGTVGQPTVRQAFGLVSFPESLDARLVREFRTSLQFSRMLTLCMAVGILWVLTFLLSMVFRAGQSQSAFRKLATLPLIGILVVPCLVLFVTMSGAMLRGESFDLSWSKNRVVCEIDRLSE